MSIFRSPEGGKDAAAQLTRGEKIQSFLSGFAHAHPTDNYLLLALHAHSGRYDQDREAGNQPAADTASVQGAEAALEHTVIIEEADSIQPTA